jgi:predicted ArsR family transcriptional regulator
MARKMNPIMLALLVRELQPGEYTCAQLAERIGLHPLTVRDYVKAMHNAKVVHLARWAPDSRGRMCVRIYKLGQGVDAPRRPRTAEQNRAAYRARAAAKAMIHMVAGAIQGV